MVGFLVSLTLNDFYDYIRAYKPDLWNSLGRPTQPFLGWDVFNKRWDLPNHASRQWSILRFFWKERCSGVNDPALNSLRQKFRIYLVVFAFLGLLLAIVPIAGFVLFGVR